MASRLARWRTSNIGLNPAFDLPQTSGYVNGASINTGASFPNRNNQITFAVNVSILQLGAAGVIAEFGDAVTGTSIWIESNTGILYAASGDVGDNGVSVSSQTALNIVGKTYRIVYAIVAGAGEARLWIDGRKVGASSAVNGTLPNGWSSGASGGVGVVSGVATSRIPTADRFNLAGAVVGGLLKIYDGNIPRRFERGPLVIGGAPVYPPITPPTLPANAMLFESNDNMLFENGNEMIFEV